MASASRECTFEIRNSVIMERNKAEERPRQQQQTKNSLIGRDTQAKSQIFQQDKTYFFFCNKPVSIENYHNKRWGDGVAFERITTRKPLYGKGTKKKNPHYITLNGVKTRIKFRYYRNRLRRDVFIVPSSSTPPPPYILPPAISMTVTRGARTLRLRVVNF